MRSLTLIVLFLFCFGRCSANVEELFSMVDIDITDDSTGKVVGSKTIKIPIPSSSQPSEASPEYSSSISSSHRPKKNKTSAPQSDYRAPRHTLRSHFALDPFKTQALFLLEEDLAASLASLQFSQKNPCYNAITRYLDEFNEDRVEGLHKAPRASLFTRNPIYIFKMIRRMYKTLNKTISGCGKEAPTNVARLVHNKFAQQNLTMPSPQDFHDATLGLIRIQFMYGLNATSDIRLGKFQDFNTGAYLNFYDCLTLAAKAIKELKAECLAYQWIIGAQLALHERKFSSVDNPEKLQTHLSVWRLRLQDLVKAATWTEVEDKLQGKLQMKIPDFDFEYKRYAPCRGEFTQDLDEHKTLFCYFNRNHPYYLINPVKTEMLSREPVMLQFYEFLGDRSIKYIRKLSTQKVLRSTIAGRLAKEAQYSDYRTSLTSAYIEEKDPMWPQPEMKIWLTRAEYLTGLDIKRPLSSDYQVAIYSAMGGHYDWHRDSLQSSAAPVLREGDRLATFLIFMENVPLGGYTAFDGAFAKPVKGSAIFWYNLHPDGTEDLDTWHAGCPVVLGYKAVVNLWIHQYNSMFKHPCKDENERVCNFSMC